MRLRESDLDYSIFGDGRWKQQIPFGDDNQKDKSGKEQIQSVN
jgi:hypothetical protein